MILSLAEGKVCEAWGLVGRVPMGPRGALLEPVGLPVLSLGWWEASPSPDTTYPWLIVVKARMNPSLAQSRLGQVAEWEAKSLFFSAKKRAIVCPPPKKNSCSLKTLWTVLCVVPLLLVEGLWRIFTIHYSIFTMKCTSIPSSVFFNRF